MVTEKTIVHGTDKDLRLLSKVGVASALANEDIWVLILDNGGEYVMSLFEILLNDHFSLFPQF